MSLQFQPPPEWLIQEYMNRKSPGQNVSDSVNQALGTYSQFKQNNQKQRMDALGTLLKGAENVDYSDPNITKAFSPLFTQAGISPDAFQGGPPAPSTGTVPSPVASDVTGLHEDQPSALIQASLQHPPHAKVFGVDPERMVAMSKTGGGRKQLTAMEQLQRIDDAQTSHQEKTGKKTGVTADQILTDGFDPVTQIQVNPKDGSAQDNQIYVGNSVDGDPVNQDKHGNFFSNGKPYKGKILSKTSETPTGSTRSSAEFATTILPHIQSMRDLVQEADKKGYIGPAAGRVYGQFMAGKVGSTGDPAADKVLGRLRATDSLLKTGAMRVHFGARGGSQMYDHFSDLLNSGKQSAALLNGSLDSIESFMQGYADAAHPGAKRDIAVVEDGYAYTPGPGGKANKANWKKQ